MANFIGNNTKLYDPPIAGLLYRIGDTLVFEDFENEAGAFGFIIKGSSKKPEFKKTVIELDCRKIISHQRIYKSEIVKLKTSPNPSRFTSKNSLLASLFSVKIDLIVFEDSSYYLFDSYNNNNVNYKV